MDAPHNFWPTRSYLLQRCSYCHSRFLPGIVVLRCRHDRCDTLVHRKCLTSVLGGCRGEQPHLANGNGRRAPEGYILSKHTPSQLHNERIANEEAACGGLLRFDTMLEVNDALKNRLEEEQEQQQQRNQHSRMPVPPSEPAPSIPQPIPSTDSMRKRGSFYLASLSDPGCCLESSSPPGSPVGTANAPTTSTRSTPTSPSSSPQDTPSVAMRMPVAARSPPAPTDRAPPPPYSLFDPVRQQQPQQQHSYLQWGPPPAYAPPQLPVSTASQAPESKQEMKQQQQPQQQCPLGTLLVDLYTTEYHSGLSGGNLPRCSSSCRSASRSASASFSSSSSLYSSDASAGQLLPGGPVPLSRLSIYDPAFFMPPAMRQ